MRFSPSCRCCGGCNPATSKITGRVSQAGGCWYNYEDGIPSNSNGGLVVTVTGPNGHASPETLTATTNSLGDYTVGVSHVGVYTATVGSPCGPTTGTVTTICNQTVTRNLVRVVPGNFEIHAFRECVGPQIEDAEILSFYYTLRKASEPPKPRPALPGAMPLKGCAAPGDYIFATVENSCMQDIEYPFTVGCSPTPIVMNHTIPARKFDRKIKVGGCAGMPLQGATVTTSGDAGSGGGTTDANGEVTIPGIKSNCWWTITVSKPPGFIPTSASWVTDCYGAYVFGVSPKTADYYPCTGCCQDPYKLKVIDGMGEHPVPSTFSGGIGGIWQSTGRTACIIKPGVTGYSVAGSPNCFGETGPINVAYRYNVVCDTSGTLPPRWVITRYTTMCYKHPEGYWLPMVGTCVGDNPTAPTGGVLAEQITVTANLGSCMPLSIPFSFSLGFPDSGTLVGE